MSPVPDHRRRRGGVQATAGRIAGDIGDGRSVAAEDLRQVCRAVPLLALVSPTLALAGRRAVDVAGIGICGVSTVLLTPRRVDLQGLD